MQTLCRAITIMSLTAIGTLSAIPVAAAPAVRRVDPLREGCYQTIQAAIDDAMPGDRVSIAGGRYREQLETRRDGLPGRPIVIAPADNQMVLITPGSELEGVPERVDGLPGVYCWQDVGLQELAAQKGFGLWEAASKLRLTRVEALEACETRFASWCYDEAGDRLYIRSSGMAPASALVYIIEGTAPVLTVSHSHLEIRGLSFAFGVHGVQLDKAQHVVINNCHAWCNRIAGIFPQGDYLTVSDNLLHHNNQQGIRIRDSVNFSTFSNNRLFLNAPNNGVTTDDSVPTDFTHSRGLYNLVSDNVIGPNPVNGYRNKYGANNSNVIRNNVVIDGFDSAARCFENNTIIANSLGPRFGIYINRVVADANPDPERCDPGGRQRRTNLIHPVINSDDPLFADPAWHDYRLQLDSPYRGLGAWPGVESVLYIDPVNGNDANHGRALSAPLRTLGKAVAVAHADYTLYLMPGEHADPLLLVMGGLSRQQPLRLRAYGKSQEVVLTGGATIRLAGEDEVDFTNTEPFTRIRPAHIVMEGLTFRKSGVSIENADHITFNNCLWEVAEGTALRVASTTNLTLNRTTFSGDATPLQLHQSSNVSLRRSLFAASGSALSFDDASLAGLQSYYNAWRAPLWQQDGTVVTSLDAWQQLATVCGDRLTEVVLGPQQTLPPDSPLMFAADDFDYIGARPAPPADLLEIANLRLAGLTPDTATLLWETPRGATEAEVWLHEPDGNIRHIKPLEQFQIFGEFFDMTFRPTGFFEAERQLALDGLKPGSAYEVVLEIKRPGGEQGCRRQIRFETPTTLPVARQLHVAPDGNDEADGLTRENAWRTLRRAAGVAAPGDCVKIWPGSYSETLRPRISGSATAPVRFESAVPRQAVIDFKESIRCGVEIINLNHLAVDGLAFTNGRFMGGHAFTIANARSITISGCEKRMPRIATFAKLRLGQAGIVAADAPGLTIEDNMIVAAVYAVGMGRCPGARIRHNTILGEGNYGISIVPDSPDEEYLIENNLFERPVMAYKTGAAIWLFNVHARLNSDYNLFHIPETHKGTIGFLVKERYAGLAAWRQASGQDQHSIEVQPIFVDPEGEDFRLHEESPGRTAGRDGAIIGVRW